MGYEFILAEVQDGVAVLTMNRPEVLNAMNEKLTYELHDAIGAANANEDIGCIVITGAGDRAFSAGGDIHEQRKLLREATEEERQQRRAGRPSVPYEVAISPKPTIGMMNGLAYGGGSALAGALDFRIGCERSTFRFLYAAYGRIGSTWDLPLQVGWPMAKELLFTGGVVDAEEAYRIGLLNHLVPSDQLRSKTMEIATTIAKNRHESVQGIKQLLLQDMGCTIQQRWANEKEFTSKQFQGYGTEQAFPEFLARKGRP